MLAAIGFRYIFLVGYGRNGTFCHALIVALESPHSRHAIVAPVQNQMWELSDIQIFYSHYLHLLISVNGEEEVTADIAKIHGML